MLIIHLTGFILTVNSICGSSLVRYGLLPRDDHLNEAYAYNSDPFWNYMTKNVSPYDTTYPNRNLWYEPKSKNEKIENRIRSTWLLEPDLTKVSDKTGWDGTQNLLRRNLNCKDRTDNGCLPFPSFLIKYAPVDVHLSGSNLNVDRNRHNLSFDFSCEDLLSSEPLQASSTELAEKSVSNGLAVDQNDKNHE